MHIIDLKLKNMTLQYMITETTGCFYDSDTYEYWICKITSDGIVIPISIA